MRIGVISDIHGNMEALSAVMRDIEAQECDKVFVLGDYAMAGPNPEIVVDWFMERKDDPKFTLIQGNTDLMIADYNEETYETLKGLAPVMAEALKYDAELLTNVQKSFLKELPMQLEVQEGGVKILLVHGSPRKNNEDILPDTPMETVEEMLVNVEAPVVLCGHTHIPCGFQTTKKQTVVNVGSVGRPFTEKPQACWLRLTIEDDGKCIFEHRFVKYEKEIAADAMRKQKFVGAEKLAQTLLEPKMRHF